MRIFSTNSSNNIITGNIVSLEITISAEDGNRIMLQKNSTIEIANIEEVIEIGGSSVILKKDAQTIGQKLSYNTQNNRFYYAIGKVAFSVGSFTLIVTGTLAKKFVEKELLQISFSEVSEEQTTLDFPIVKIATPIVIDAFTANTAIVQKGRTRLELNFTISGKPEEIHLLENGRQVSIKDFKLSSINDEHRHRFYYNFLNAEHYGFYELSIQAKKGDQLVSKKLGIQYVDQTAIYSRSTGGIGRTIVNFCAAQNGDNLFALMVDEHEQLTLNYTYEIDGNETWHEINVQDIELLKPFTTSPLVHLQSTNERSSGSLGRLLLIGGSRVNSDVITNKVAIITLSPTKENTISIHQNNWTPRFGHACVLCQNGENKNTIWMLGGEDSDGDTYNEVLTSTDGIIWKKEVNAPWGKRSILSACVWFDMEKAGPVPKAICIAGGYKGIGDVFVPDIWSLDIKTQKWSEIKLASSANLSSRVIAFGIGFGGIENSTSHKGLFILGADLKEFIYRLDTNNRNENVFYDDGLKMPSLEAFNQGVVLTAYFKSCLWFMNMNSQGNLGVGFSDLYYRIPTIHSNTLKI